MTAERLVVDGLGRLPQFVHAGLTDGLVFVSGTLGTTEGLTLADGVAAQTTQTLHNMGRILEASGASWDDVVKVSVFLADMDEFAVMNAAYGDFFETEPPARITVGGAVLALGAAVEMECIASRPGAVSPTRSAGSIRRDTGFVDHDGERLYFEDCGPIDAPVLVLSHGAGGNHAIWFQQVEFFAHTRRVITWDHRSYGRSTDRAGTSGPAVASADLLAILDHLDVTDADFVGQSMGGWTTVGVALERPSIVRTMVLADSLGGFTSDAVNHAMANASAAPAQLPDGLGAHPAIGAAFSRREPALAHLYQSLGLMGSVDLDAIIGRLMTTTHDEREAAQIRCPVLCIVGEHDALFPVGAVRAVAAMFDNATVAEIPGCGHSPYYEAPKAWNALLDQFLEAT